MAEALHNREADDRLIDERISIILRAGMVISAIVIAIGGLLYLLRHGGPVPDYRVFHGIAAPLTSVTGIVHSALQGSSAAIIQMGLLLLIATPVARVLFSVIAFWMERDFLYVVISGLVLLVLLYSLLVHGA